MKKLTIAVLCFLVVSLVISTVFISGCAEKKEIKIGAILPLSGPYAKYGEIMKRGIDLAVDEINNQGGIKGIPLKVYYDDDQGDIKQSVSVMEKLIKIDKIKVIIGGISSSQALALAPISRKNRVIVFSPAASAPDLRNSSEYIFRNAVSDFYEAQQMANLTINTLNFTKVVIIYINNDYGLGLKNAFTNEFVRLGGTVVAEESFEQDASDFRTQLTKIKNKRPQAIYMISYKESINILKQSKELGIKSQFLTTPLFEDPDIINKTGIISEGVIYAGRGYDPTSERAEVKNFIESYKTRYGNPPEMYFPARTYDAVKILAFVIEKVGSNPENIKKEIPKIKDFAGVSGITSYDDKTGDVMQPIILKIVKNGKFVKFND